MTPSVKPLDLDAIQARCNAAADLIQAVRAFVRAVDGYDYHCERVEEALERLDTTDLPAALDEIKRLRKVAEAAREVWDSVPATRDEAHPSVMRHAKAMNDLRAALEDHDAGR